MVVQDSMSEFLKPKILDMFNITLNTTMQLCKDGFFEKGHSLPFIF